MFFERLTVKHRRKEVHLKTAQLGESDPVPLRRTSLKLPILYRYYDETKEQASRGGEAIGERRGHYRDVLQDKNGMYQTKVVLGPRF